MTKLAIVDNELQQYTLPPLTDIIKEYLLDNAFVITDALRACIAGDLKMLKLLQAKCKWLHFPGDTFRQVAWAHGQLVICDYLQEEYNEPLYITETPQNQEAVKYNISRLSVEQLLDYFKSPEKHYNALFIKAVIDAIPKPYPDDDYVFNNDYLESGWCAVLLKCVELRFITLANCNEDVTHLSIISRAILYDNDGSTLNLCNQCTDNALTKDSSCCWEHHPLRKAIYFTNKWEPYLGNDITYNADAGVVRSFDNDSYPNKLYPTYYRLTNGKISGKINIKTGIIGPLFNYRQYKGLLVINDGACKGLIVTQSDDNISVIARLDGDQEVALNNYDLALALTFGLFIRQ